MRTTLTLLIALIVIGCGVALKAPSSKPAIQIKTDAKAGSLAVLINGKQTLTYQHGKQWAIPHFHPLNSPSGKSLTVQKTEPFPHHRSIWIVDRVKMGKLPDVDFYHCWKNYNQPKKPESGFRHFIRHEKFTQKSVRNGHATIGMDLKWIVNQSKPVLDEHREVKIIPLGNGEYLVDFSFKLTASYGDVKFLSDWVHYAWPYLRMHKQFNGEAGGTITDDLGRTGQKQTNNKYAKWMDYSNTVDGVTEGLSVFIYPDGKKHKWLTREYGTFGPRRADALSGTKFTLKKGKSLVGHVGILVHKGDVTEGKVAKRYQLFVDGKL